MLIADLPVAAILPFFAAGFAAQLIDGALGMAFGVISSTLLISLGLPPAAASASVHVVECFTTAVSGISHALHRNVDWRLFFRLGVPGMIGGALGAYVLSSVDASVARPFVLAYLAAIAVYLLIRGLFFAQREGRAKIVEPLGLAGGFLDAAGGGGWGPVVASNLLLQGETPRRAIGTVNTVEFFVTMTISATFITRLGLASFTLATAGLLAGGVAAAPLGGYIARAVKPRLLLVMVGIVLLLTSGYGIVRALN